MKETGCWAANEIEGKFPVGSQAADKQGKDVYYTKYAQYHLLFFLLF